MALTLGWHIVLASFGVALPALIWLVERRGLRHGDSAALVLARRWSKVAAVLFAVGAVSGTVLSVEMGILWPGLMGRFGAVIGLPFALEGVAFFVEAILLGIYLYGWDRLAPRVHHRLLVGVMAAGATGTFCVLAVNAWMNAPAGFRIVGDPLTGEIVDVDPWAAMFNDAVWLESLHMFLAAYMVAGFVVASVYAAGMRRGRDDHHHRLALRVALGVAGIAALAQPLVGHFAGQRVASAQPAKFAAMELVTETTEGADLLVGGVLVDGRVVGGIELPIPGLTSFLAHNDPGATVVGLDAVPADARPPANVVHLAFQLMVGLGTALAALGAFVVLRLVRGRDLPTGRHFLTLVVAAGPAAVVALEAGWVTTEVGRQPWIVHELVRVGDAVTDAGGLWWIYAGTVAVYTTLTVATLVVLRSMARRWRGGEEKLEVPYGPHIDPEPASVTIDAS
ncbi:MAG: cytochrome ubiquinol oxidase subunit I [Actinomyces sp.]|nr:MAG: cytochrome ubiquinol oxidase subunit I [Actinomyces sp.]